MKAVALIFAVMIAAEPAIAQTATGTLIPGRPTTMMEAGSIMRSMPEVQPPENAIANGRAMVACVARAHRDQVATLLAATDQAAFDHRLAGLTSAMQGCLLQTPAGQGVSSVEMKFSRNVMRGLFAEASLRLRGLPTLSSVKYVSVQAGSDWITDDAGPQVVLRLADCLGAREPARTEALLYAVPGSPAEADAFAVLGGSIPGCLEQNVKLATNRTGLRLALASAIDRRSREPAMLAGKN